MAENPGSAEGGLHSSDAATPSPAPPLAVALSPYVTPEHYTHLKNFQVQSSRVAVLVKGVCYVPVLYYRVALP